MEVGENGRERETGWRQGGKNRRRHEGREGGR